MRSSDLKGLVALIWTWIIDRRLDITPLYIWANHPLAAQFSAIS